MRLKKNNTIKNKDVNIELIRIIACFMVIALHVSLNYIGNISIDKTELFIKCLFTDGVTLFLFITGYFLFNNKTSYKYIILKIIKRIVIPVLITIFLTDILHDWISDTNILLYFNALHFKEIKNIIKSFLFLKIYDIDYISHLWYIFEYIKMILWFPILKLFCADEKKKIRYYIIGLGIMYILINSLQIIFAGNIKYTPFMIGTNVITQVLIGYEIYKHNELLFNKNKIKNIIIGLLMIFLGLILRYFLQIYIYQKFNNFNYFLHTGRLTNLIISLGIFVVIKNFKIPEKLKDTILYIASHTFYIYLIHYALIIKMNSIGLKSIIYNFLSKNHIPAKEFIFTILYANVIFFICLIICILIKLISKILVYKK